MSRNPSTNIAVSGQVVPASIKKPSSRVFRDAWEFDPSKPVIKVNMDKAKELKREQLRRERNELLLVADAAWFKAMETNSGVAEAVAFKQKLRDLPEHPAIENAKTPEELEAITVNQLLAE